MIVSAAASENRPELGSRGPIPDEIPWWWTFGRGIEGFQAVRSTKVCSLTGVINHLAAEAFAFLSISTGDCSEPFSKTRRLVTCFVIHRIAQFVCPGFRNSPWITLLRLCRSG